MRPILLLTTLSLFACGGSGNKNEDVDSDGDGLLDSEEADIGSDPQNTDSDGDGLQDGEEVDMGADPTSTDTDGDGYLDPWEVTEGTDPADAESVIYAGGWPYNPNKDSIEDPGFGQAEEGGTLPRFAWPDQFGDTVDIYDFAGRTTESGSGMLTIIDLSGMWCYYCQELAKMIEGNRNYFSTNGYDEYYEWVDGMEALIAEDKVQWVTLLDSDWSGRSISEDELVEWYAEFENPYVPVMADLDAELYGYMSVGYYPTLLVVDENMEIVSYNAEDYTAALDYVMKHYDD